MSFEEYWQNIGQRTQAFDAKAWALAGWNGHKIHGGEAPIEEETKLLGAYEGYSG